MLLDQEEGAEEAEREDGRALKSRRRQEAPTPINVMSFEGTHNTELPEFQDTARAAREVREGSSGTVISSLRGVVELRGKYDCYCV